MQITMTDGAVEQIKNKLPAGDGELKLAFDTEDCGCAVTGVPTLWITDRPNKQDVRAEGTPIPVWYDKHHELYFEDRMTLDYEPSRGDFVLKSRGQIYNAKMRLVDKRQQH
ncbi:iron-sulfur cluster biosynthesis family protein [Paenibacillus xerothermodurans]|uniref:Core domain-containing protein n=1 Tax=Paenibacillus xerothermodurans TaxID=1977292 RepID=A0A2W1NVX2_PAEXE|nr:iron-sulfur cluster biosynthesis family protein [Paenibacillus xerothermodurans]PZE21866.1 hypothetical protein CBW46_005530 [Paenibacillus xerothermodurans]